MVRIPALFGTLLLLLCTPAYAATIGLSVPLSGDYASFGQQFQAGAEMAFQNAETKHGLSVIDDACDTDGASQAAQAFANIGVRIVLGYLCNNSAVAAANTLRGTSIPIVIGGARSPRLIKDREREDWNLWRLSPGDDYPVNIAAWAIAAKWKQTPFAIVDDGTIYGRRFADSLRQKLQETGLEAQIIDSFRTGLSTQAALVRRLKRSGVAAVFIAASEAQDLITIIADSNRLKLPFEFITTEALRIMPFLDEKPEIAMPLEIIDWWNEPSIEIPALSTEKAPTRSFLMGYASAQIALKFLQMEQNNLNAGMAGASFETIFGNISFNADGSATFNPYHLMNWNGGNFIRSSTAGERQP